MKLKCPQCRYDFDVREATKDQALIDIIRMQADFAPHCRLVFEYAELFGTVRPGFKAAKLLRILTEVRDMWTAGSFAFQKRVYLISKEGMAQALKTVCNKNFETGLDSHNYLKRVMVTVSEAEAQKRSAASEKALLEREASIRAHGKPEDLRAAERPVAIGDVAKNLPWRKE